MKLAVSAALVSVATAALVLITMPAAQSKPDYPEPTKSTAPPTLNTCLILRPSLNDPNCPPLFTLPSTTTKPPATTPKPTTAKPATTTPKEGSNEHGNSGKDSLISSCSNTREGADKAPRNFIHRGSKEIKKGGKTLGRLEVYYSPDNGGTNCAQVIHQDAPRKDPLYASVRMSLSEPVKENGRETKKGIWDRGQYKTLAGGIFFAGTNKKCVDVEGTIGDESVHFLKDFCG